MLAPGRERGYERQSNRAGKRGGVEERKKGKRKGGGKESRAYPNMP